MEGDRMAEFNSKVPEGFDAKYDDVNYGEMSSIEYESSSLKAPRKAVVILPAGYDTSKEYPVLYLFHGLGGHEQEWFSSNAKYIIGNLIDSKEAEEMIVVLPNIRAREDSSIPAEEEMYTLEHYKAFDNFINILKDDLMPYIEANYSIKEGRKNTAIAGLSMGGRESLYIGFTLPEKFGYIGAFTPAPGVLGYTNFNVSEKGLFTEENFVVSDEYETLIMIVKGKSDTLVKGVPEKYHKVLETNGVDHIYYETAGGHDFKVWDNALYNFAKELFH